MYCVGPCFHLVLKRTIYKNILVLRLHCKGRNFHSVSWTGKADQSLNPSVPTLWGVSQQSSQMTKVLLYTLCICLSCIACFFFKETEYGGVRVYGQKENYAVKATSQFVEVLKEPEHCACGVGWTEVAYHFSAYCVGRFVLWPPFISQGP